jgi:hypothetical protein
MAKDVVVLEQAAHQAASLGRRKIRQGWEETVVKATVENFGMENRTPAELVHLVCKLRWMGLDDEAARMEALLAEVRSAGSVLAGPVDTD